MIGKIGTAAAAGLTAALLFAGVAGATQTDLTMVKAPIDCPKTEGAAGGNGVLPELPKLPGMDGLDTGSANPGAAKQQADPKCDDSTKNGAGDKTEKKSTPGDQKATPGEQKKATPDESGVPNGN
ncbi:hypothetical protein [Nocardia altamirensis]|uniref:hypothetical protein n=1 Tax=Nocardia altamirensis TaxID=472158 RepID=UPI0008406106|nr:hypothetical protein [Nocardia altamirensis]